MKEVAQIIKNDRYATFAFSVLKSNKEISARELFAALHLKNKRSFIDSVDDFAKINPSMQKNCLEIER